MIKSYIDKRVELYLQDSKSFVHLTPIYNEPHQQIHRYRQIQTTSTKCQYHAAASNPKWCEVEKWFKQTRDKHTKRNDDPINTCSPWNPVATKNVVPYTLSAIVKGAAIYSPACRNVKYRPKDTVKIRAWIAPFHFPSINLW